MKLFKFFQEMERARTYILFALFALIIEVCFLLISNDTAMLIKFTIVIVILIAVLLYGIYIQYSSWKTIQNIGDKLVELRRLERKYGKQKKGK